MLIDFASLTILLAIGGEPPTELCLFKPGVNESTKGPILWDAKACDMVMEKYRSMGRRVTFDYAHASLDATKAPNPQEAAKSAGSAALELRDKCLYLVDIKWTDAAAEMIKRREYEYLSPVFPKDKDNRPTWLVNIALTNIPALHDQKPLMAATIVPYRSYPLIAPGMWDATAAEMRVRKWASSDGSGDKDKMDWQKYASAFTYVDPEMRESFTGYKLLHHDVVDGELRTSRPGVQAAAGAMQGARGGVDMPQNEISGGQNHIAQHYHQWDGKAPWERKEEMSVKTKAEVLALLSAYDITEKDLQAMFAVQPEGPKTTALVALAVGLPESADNAAIVGRLSALKEAEAATLASLGAKTSAEAMGKLEALKVKASERDTFAAQISASQVGSATAEIHSALDKAIAEGKILPAEKEKRLEQALASYTAVEKKVSDGKIPQAEVHERRQEALASGLTWLTALVEALPVRVQLDVQLKGKPLDVPPPDGKQGKEKIVLTDEQKAMCRLTGVSEEDFSKMHVELNPSLQGN